MGIGDKLAKSGPRKWLLGCGVLALLGCAGLGAVVLQVVDYPVVAMRADKVAAEYRAAGLPWTKADVDRKIAPEDNASPAFLAEIGSQAAWPQRSTKDLEDAIAQADYVEARRIVNYYQREIALFEEASRAEAISFEKDWDLGVKVLFPEYAKFKAAAKLLSWRAEIRAHEGDLSGAFSDLRAGYRLSNLIAKERNLISMLVGIACQAITLRGAEYVAAARPGDAHWIRQVREEIAGWNSEIELETAMKGELYFTMSIARNLRDESLYLAFSGSEHSEAMFEPVDESKLVREGFGPGTVRRAYQTRNMEVAIGVKAIMEHYKDDFVGIGKAMDDYIIREVQVEHKLSNMLGKVVYPVYSQAGAALAKNEILPEMTAIALQAGEYKARTGRLPKNWEELGVTPLVDPFSKEEMKIVVRDGVFCVYLVGPNGEDEGGFNESGKAGDDIGVRFPMKKRSVAPTNVTSPPPPGT